MTTRRKQKLNATGTQFSPANVFQNDNVSNK